MLALRRRNIVAGFALVATALGVFVLLYFEPQKLFIDDVVHEPPPAASTLSTGSFRSFEHASSGTARVLALPDGRRYVRFEDFRTSNGPALKVYLSATPATGPGDAFDDRYVDLGDLKGNIGEQNYAIPPDVELARYRSVVVWCARFHVPFAAAAL
jgi:hypothetical protein